MEPSWDEINAKLDSLIEQMGDARLEGLRRELAMVRRELLFVLQRIARAVEHLGL